MQQKLGVTAMGKSAEQKLIEAEPLCVRIPTAAKLLGISRGTGYEMVRLGQLPVIRCGARRLVVPLAALRRMLEGAGRGDRPDK